MFRSLGEMEPNFLLVAMDVTSLYTNIPQMGGCWPVRKALSQHRDPLDNPTNHSLISLLKTVLTCNNFQFNGKHYLQVGGGGGTALGTRVAPSLDNIYTGEFEDLYPYPHQPLLWKRYIDDVVMVWPHSQEKLQDFVKPQHSYSQHPVYRGVFRQFNQLSGHHPLPPWGSTPYHSLL